VSVYSNICQDEDLLEKRSHGRSVFHSLRKISTPVHILRVVVHMQHFFCGD